MCNFCIRLAQSRLCIRLLAFVVRERKLNRFLLSVDSFQVLPLSLFTVHVGPEGGDQHENEV